jgi:hypothetical protein
MSEDLPADDGPFTNKTSGVSLSHLVIPLFSRKRSPATAGKVRDSILQHGCHPLPV